MQSRNFRSIPRWLARLGVLLIFVVAIPIGHGVVPWALSRLAERHGWNGGFPSAWNLSGLGPIAFGIGILAWVAIVAARNVPARVDRSVTASYLVTEGPYRFTRNPMYVGELSLWLGWAILFGSLVVALGFAVLAAILQLILVPWEERSLRRRLGDRYRTYAAMTPRWLGRRSA
jgi:protein-S-isoprenylcysteine O-methyltransferase Ste14